MTTQRLVRCALIPLTAVTLIAALLFLTMRNPSPATAADLPEWQQTHGNAPMTHTMPMTETQSPMTDHQMHEGMAGMGNEMMNQAQAGMGEQMVSMGRRMQMMGMMMQMMGQMHKMHEQMHGQMHGQMQGQMQGMMNQEMPMMQGMMDQAMPMTHTMPMTDDMTMGADKGMMDGMMGGTMDMPMMDGMMDMDAMHGMMGQMMDTMMAEMHAMHQMMGMGHGAMDHGAMNHDTASHAPAQHEAMTPGAPMTHTMPAAGATGVTPTDLTQSAQAGAVEIIATALNLTNVDAATIDFEIALNSHSVTIDLDLVNSAILRVGAVEVAPAVWETTTPAGHHIKGLLRFPRTTEDGAALLAEATDITLVISGLPDDAERTFTWGLE